MTISPAQHALGTSPATVSLMKRSATVSNQVGHTQAIGEVDGANRERSPLRRAAPAAILLRMHTPLSI